MWQRVGREDFSNTSDVMNNSAGLVWKVCEEYDLKRLPGAPRKEVDSYVVVPKYPYDPTHFDKWRTYKPLEDTPDLFLKFARLYGADNQTGAMVTWVRSYGDLGNGELFQKPSSSQYARDFRKALGQAAGVLALYEAVLNDDNDRAKTTILEDIPFVGPWWGTYHGLPDGHPRKDRRYIARQIAMSVEEIYEGDYVRYALATAAEEVRTIVSSSCRPSLKIEEGARKPPGVTASWHFRHLLGAMFLQMYWLMVAGSDLTRCEYCGRLISLARPNPEGRKRRQDKKFCDAACRQSQHRNKKKDSHPT